jgi:L-iditol 2-dehydrogenase
MSRALVYHGPDDLRVEERDGRVPGPGELALRVAACGICGTDLRIASGRHRAYPAGTVRVPGHEVAGTVAAVGDGVELEEGQGVFVAPNIGCGRCRQCRAGRVNLCERPEAIGITRDGGFSETLLLGADVVEQGNVLPVPDGADLRAVSLAEPLACALHGQRAVSVAEGDLIVIAGAGPIGLMHLRLALLARPSAVVVSEPSEERRRQALSWGATEALDPGENGLAEAVSELSGGRGADVVITAAPAPAAQRQALELAAPAGRINFFGGLPRDDSEVALDTNLIHYKELVVTGTTANTTDDCLAALELVLNGDVDTGAMIGASYGLDDGREAIERAGAGDVIKVVIEP